MSGMEKWEHLKISFTDIKDATNDFGKTIGKGGFGLVYEGELFNNGRHIKVAVKRLCYVRDTDGILLLADVAKEYYANDKLDSIIDPILREQMSPESLRKFSAIAYKCLQDREHRPLMGVVQKELEETLNIQMHNYKMGTDNGSSSGSVSSSFNKSGGRKSARFNIGDGAPGSSRGSVKPNGDDDHVEFTLDGADGSMAVHSAKVAGVDVEDQIFDSSVQISSDLVDKYRVDKDADGRITQDQFKEIENSKMLLLQEPTPNVRGESEILSQMLSQKLKTTHHANPIKRWYEDLKYFIQDNWQRCWVIILWLGIMVGLFTWKYTEYKHRAVYDVLGSCVCIAKGAAETLKLNMAIILLPVCRKTITWLRNKTKLEAVLPFDDNLNFHKVIGVAITIGVGLHAISHLTCIFPRLIHATEEEYKPMRQFFGDQAENYWHFLKEVEGYTGIIMLVLMTIAFTLATSWLRRGRLNLPTFSKKLTGFNAFWYSHHLFIIVYAMLIVHGIKLYLTKEWYKKTTWMYLAFPISLYACERLIRAVRSSVKIVKILKVAIYPGNVLALHMSKPQGFKYKSGQYMFVNCADVSPFEWHPFFITSAPGDDYLSVHIRTLGDWTRQLKTVLSEVCKPPLNGKSGLLRADRQGENLNFPRVLIDGPYAAPTQDYKKYNVVLLVGLGIGAAPMISIVKDILNIMKAKEEEENALENGTTLQKNKSGSTSSNNFRTTRAYFYWVTREQGSFDWFKSVMNEAAGMDKNGVIEMHNYCTSVYEEGDARSAIITVLQRLNHAKNGVDVVSGTRVMSHFGKPDWRGVYKQIALNHTGSRIGVFYHGAPPIAQELKQLASDFSHRTSTKFEFHKQNL
ncbi:hypothetical protein L1987_30720 [Smallanthus sonchifolius]|uniref:Uncharacterized protein n=1 Tax=Smallanthus sonchifolius TaxID=185202 RepID=A0ACB9I3D6_9ASTR|nr:hypothetical protein L1987_30720 [Smallanthus sonchifolius]